VREKTTRSSLVQRSSARSASLHSSSDMMLALRFHAAIFLPLLLLASLPLPAQPFTSSSFYTFPRPTSARAGSTSTATVSQRLQKPVKHVRGASGAAMAVGDVFTPTWEVLISPGGVQFLFCDMHKLRMPGHVCACKLGAQRAGFRRPAGSCKRNE
jgi:hypothetical protein